MLNKKLLEEDKANLQNRKWYIFKWEIIIILSLAFLAAFLNEIPNLVIRRLGDGSIDPILSYPLRNSIVYTSISLFITIGVSIFIGVYTEIGRFAGKYGSAIFILVPSFVWLMSDRSDDNIDHIVAMAEFLGTIIFWSITAICILFTILTLAKLYWRARIQSIVYRSRTEFIYNYINRIIIVLLNVLIVLMLGYSLIDYGVLTLHLTDVMPADKVGHPNLGNYNLHSEGFTTYIAILAAFFAVLMVSIGLTNTFVSQKAVAIDGDLDDEELIAQGKETSIEEVEEKSEHVLDDVKEDDDGK